MSRLNRLRKKCFFVIPSEARDLLFFANPKKKQIPRANPALRNDLLRVFPQPLQPVGFVACVTRKKLDRLKPVPLEPQEKSGATKKARDVFPGRVFWIRQTLSNLRFRGSAQSIYRH